MSMQSEGNRRDHVGRIGEAPESPLRLEANLDYVKHGFVIDLAVFREAGGIKAPDSTEKCMLVLPGPLNPCNRFGRKQMVEPVDARPRRQWWEVLKPVLQVGVSEIVELLLDRMKLSVEFLRHPVHVALLNCQEPILPKIYACTHEKSTNRDE